jgi:hypothetical protein
VSSFCSFRLLVSCSSPLSITPRKPFVKSFRYFIILYLCGITIQNENGGFGLGARGAIFRKILLDKSSEMCYNVCRMEEQAFRGTVDARQRGAGRPHTTEIGMRFLPRPSGGSSPSEPAPFPGYFMRQAGIEQSPRFPTGQCLRNWGISERG